MQSAARVRIGELSRRTGVSAELLRAWEQRYGHRGGRWEEHEPGYRYAWEMRNDARYRNRSWTEAEPELRRDWETRYHDRPWDRRPAPRGSSCRAY